mmetsp:Transcript_4389/g.6699  ORF Transcript_4389/g.6699 Transcript_4389/m.6699 type:complete len:194 (-) Transcript_4389:68-649(-)
MPGIRSIVMAVGESLPKLNSDELSESNAFCTIGEGTISYTDGFHTTLAHRAHCLNAYFPEWTLNSGWKFCTAFVATALIAFSFQCYTFRRVEMMKRMSSRIDVLRGENWIMSKRQKILVHSSYGIQQMSGYILMLVVMTYSIELFAAVLVGLMVGFHYSSSKLPIASSPSPSRGESWTNEQSSNSRTISRKGE